MAETAETAGYGKERSSQCLRHRAFRSCIPGRTCSPTCRPVNSGSGQHSRYWKSPLQCEQADGRRAECLQSGSSDLIVAVSVLSVGDSESLQLGHTAPQKPERWLSFRNRNRRNRQRGRRQAAMFPQYRASCSSRICLLSSYSDRDAGQFARLRPRWCLRC